jgi:hypothetical protein
MRFIGPGLVVLIFGPLAALGLYAAARGHHWDARGTVSLIALVLAIAAFRLRAQVLAIGLLIIALYGLATLNPSF